MCKDAHVLLKFPTSVIVVLCSNSKRSKKIRLQKVFTNDNALRPALYISTRWVIFKGLSSNADYTTYFRQVFRVEYFPSLDVRNPNPEVSSPMYRGNTTRYIHSTGQPPQFLVQGGLLREGWG